jgi:hypothetical protein
MNNNQLNIVNFLRMKVSRFSLGTLASSTTKTDRHDIAEILLKVPSGVKTPKI